MDCLDLSYSNDRLRVDHRHFENVKGQISSHQEAFLVDIEVGEVNVLGKFEEEDTCLQTLSFRMVDHNLISMGQGVQFLENCIKSVIPVFLGK